MSTIERLNWDRLQSSTGDKASVRTVAHGMHGLELDPVWANMDGGITNGASSRRNHRATQYIGGGRHRHQSGTVLKHGAPRRGPLLSSRALPVRVIVYAPAGGHQCPPHHVNVDEPGLLVAHACLLPSRNARDWQSDPGRLLPRTPACLRQE